MFGIVLRAGILVGLIVWFSAGGIKRAKQREQELGEVRDDNHILKTAIEKLTAQVHRLLITPPPSPN